MRLYNALVCWFVIGHYFCDGSWFEVRRQMRIVGALAIAVTVVAAAWLLLPNRQSEVEPKPFLQTTHTSSKAEVPSHGADGLDEGRVTVTRVTYPKKAVNVDTSEWAARLAARGDRRDLGAMIETFEESLECRRYHSAIEALRAVLEHPRHQDLTKESVKKLEDLDIRLARIQETADRAEALCAGSDWESVEHAYHDAKLNAALLGDPMARACFVTGGPQAQIWEAMEYQVFLGQRYAQYTPALMQVALELADPYVAWSALYRFTASPPVDAPPLGGPPSTMPLPDAYLTWRVARLTSLRATPQLRSDYENSLAMMAEQGAIDASDIARADAWAQATYEQEFAGQPPIDFSSPGPCWPRAWR